MNKSCVRETCYNPSGMLFFLPSVSIGMLSSWKSHDFARESQFFRSRNSQQNRWHEETTKKTPRNRRRAALVMSSVSATSHTPILGLETMKQSGYGIPWNSFAVPRSLGFAHLPRWRVTLPRSPQSELARVPVAHVAVVHVEAQGISEVSRFFPWIFFPNVCNCNHPWNPKVP